MINQNFGLHVINYQNLKPWWQKDYTKLIYFSDLDGHELEIIGILECKTKPKEENTIIT